MKLVEISRSDLNDFTYKYLRILAEKPATIIKCERRLTKKSLQKQNTAYILSGPVYERIKKELGPKLIDILLEVE